MGYEERERVLVCERVMSEMRKSESYAVNERESMLRDKSIVIERGERSIVIGKMVLCNRGVCVFVM